MSDKTPLTKLARLAILEKRVKLLESKIGTIYTPKSTDPSTKIERIKVLEARVNALEDALEASPVKPVPKPEKKTKED